MKLEREEESDDAVQAIVRLVLHETRTPLNAICGFLDLLLAGAGGPLGAEALDYVEQVAAAARRLERGLGHLQEIAAMGVIAAPCPAPVDLEAGLTAAGFSVTEAVDVAVCGDQAAWRRACEAAFLFLRNGQKGVPPLRAVFRLDAGGGLELLLASEDGARRGPDAGLLLLELARRLAGRVGGELRQTQCQSGIVVGWGAGSVRLGHGADGQMAARPIRGEEGP